MKAGKLCIAAGCSEGFPRLGLIPLVLCLSGCLCPSGVCSRCLEASRNRTARPSLRDVGSPRLGAMRGTSRDAGTRAAALLLRHLLCSPRLRMRCGEVTGVAVLERLPLGSHSCCLRALRELCQPALAFPILSGMDGKPLKIHLLTPTVVVIGVLLWRLNFTDPQNKQPFGGCVWNPGEAGAGRKPCLTLAHAACAAFPRELCWLAGTAGSPALGIGAYARSSGKRYCKKSGGGIRRASKSAPSSRPYARPALPMPGAGRGC